MDKAAELNAMSLRDSHIQLTEVQPRNLPSPLEGEGCNQGFCDFSDAGEHLCSWSSILNGLRLPKPVLGDESVGEGGEFSGDGQESGFCGFTVCDEALVEGTHVLVAALGAECRQVKSAADLTPSTPDDAYALPLSGVVSDRGQACECANLLVGQRSELGKERNECHRHDTPEARD